MISNHWKKNRSKKNKKQVVFNYFRNLQNNKYHKKLGFKYDIANKNIFNLDSNKKNILFVCTTDYEHQAISFNYKRFYISKYWSHQINTIKSLIKIIKNKNNYLLIIKAHPNFKFDKKLEKKLKSLQSNKVVYLSTSSKINTYELIKKSDIICSFGSSLELFSSFYGKKTISFFKTLWLNLT